MPTPIFICGAECNIAALGGTSPTKKHWDSHNGTISTTTYRSDGGGVRSYNLNGTTMQKLFVAGSRTIVMSYYVRFASYTNGCIILQLWPGSSVHLDIISDNFTAQIAGGTARTGPAVSLDTWYRIDLKLVTSANPWVLSWSIDGAAQTDATSAIAAADIQYVYFAFSGTFNMFVDDIVISATSGDYPLGAHGVTELHPNADGTHSFTAGDFQDNTSHAILTSDTDVYTRLDELGGVTTDYIKQVVINAAGYCEVGFTDPASALDAWGMEVIGVWHAAGTNSDQMYIKINDGGTINNTDGGDVSNTGITYTSKQLETAPSTGAWTQAKLNAVKARIGYSGDVVAVPYCDAIILEIAQTVAETYYKSLSAVASNTPGLSRALTCYRAFSVTAGTTPVFSRIKTAILSFSAAASNYVGIVVNKIVAGTTYYVNALATAVGVTVLGRIRTAYRSLSATASGSPVFTKLSTMYRALSVVETSVVTVTKSFIKVIALSVTESSSATLTKITTYCRSLSVVETSVVVLTRIKTCYRSLSVVSITVPVFSKITTYYRALSVTASSVATMTKGMLTSISLSVVAVGIATLSLTKIIGSGLVAIFKPIFRPRRR